MDPVSAVSLAASIIAVVEFTAEVSVATKKLLQDGTDAIPNNAWLEELTERNQVLAGQVRQSASKRSATSKAETAVMKLAERCEEQSKGLIELLTKLKVPARSDGSKSKLKAVQAVLKTMLKNGELESRRRKLESLERQLCVMLLCVVRQSQDQEFAELKIIIDQQGKDLPTRVLGMKDEVQKSVGKLQATMDAGFANIETHRVSAEEQIKIDRIIDSLKYPNMDLRKSMITDAADDQYQWAFGGLEQPPEDDRHTYRPPDAPNSRSDSPQRSVAGDTSTPDTDAASKDGESSSGGDSDDEGLNNLQNWLKSDHSLFWICGLPASGKSTMMRVLRRSESVTIALEKRAAERELFVLEHYFWVAGTPLQRSHLAVLQDICYQVLLKRPALAISACAKRYNSPQSTRDWTASELCAMISSIAQMSDVKIFMVIDGLDECEEKQHGPLLKTLTTFCALPNIKLVVSSRPWTVFQKALGQRPNLKLDARNSSDIFRYVCRRLEEADEPVFAPCGPDPDLFLACIEHTRLRNGSDAKKLVHEVCNCAGGDFLWTELVLGAIVARIQEGESITAARKALSSFPKDLDEYYYNLVYSRIHDTYCAGKYSETAMAIQIALSWNEFDSVFIAQPSLACFWGLREGRTDFGGMVENPDFGLCQQPLEVDPPTAERMAWEAYNFIGGCCRDILVLGRQGQGIKDEESLSLASPVVFKHRCVYDFTRTPRMRDILDSQIPSHFRYRAFPVHLGLAVLKIIWSDEGSQEDWWVLCFDFIWVMHDELAELQLDSDLSDTCPTTAATFAHEFDKMIVRRHFDRISTPA